MTDVASRHDRSGCGRRGATRARMSLVARSCVPGRLREVVSGLGQVSSTAHKRERAEADGGRLRRRGHGRRAVAAGDETNQVLEPGRAAEAGGHVAQAMPEAGARAQEERANGRRAE